RCGAGKPAAHRRGRHGAPPRAPRGRSGDGQCDSQARHRRHQQERARARGARTQLLTDWRAFQMRRIVLSALFMIAAMLGATDGHAGYVAIDSAYCSKDSTGAGWCGGTMRGFRNDPGANTYAEFSFQHDSLILWFMANYGGQYFSCSFPDPGASVLFR